MARGLLSRLAAAEVGAARPLRRLSELAALAPHSFRAANQRGCGAPAALLDLTAAHAARDAAGARIALLALSTACHFTSDGNAREQPDALAAQSAVVSSGGYHLLVLLLMPHWSDAAGAPGAGTLSEVRAEAAAILRELCFGVRGFGEMLSGHAPLAPRLLDLCADAELFSTASALLEEVATASRATLRVAALPRFADTLRGLPAPHLALFCRVLSLLVYENEPLPPPPAGAPPLARAEHDAPRFCDANHLALVAVPELIPRLVRLLRAPAASLGPALSSRVAQQLLAALPPTAQTVIPQLLGLLLSRADTGWDDDADAPSAEALAALEGGAAPPPALPGGAHPYVVEVLFLLSALLGGPAKCVAQDAAAAAGLVPVLERLFDAIDWDAPAEGVAESEAHENGLHGPGCTCNPASALKLQLLRCVHAFLERDADNRRNKRLLLSPADLAKHYADDAPQCANAAATAAAAAAAQAAAAAAAAGGAGGSATTQPSMLSAMAAARRRLSLCIARTAPAAPALGLPPSPLPPLPPPAAPPAAVVPGGTGLMGKLLLRLVAEPTGSPHRFWLTSCAEAFLRGGRAADQRFAAASQLLPHLVADIVAPGPKPAGSLQISCDLLGELLKYNRALFAALDEQLASSPGGLERLTGVLMAHLVDSNVLLRAVALSVESFALADAAAAAAAEGSELADGAMGEHGACGADWAAQEEAMEVDDGPAGGQGAGSLGVWLCEEWLQVLEALMTAVSAHEVDQENICCVNSAILMLTFARRHGRLASTLAALRARSRPPGDPRPPACVAFTQLLRCWRDHYVGRARDCASLEFSTQVPFTEWVRCVDALNGPPESPLALLHVIDAPAAGAQH